MITFDSFKLDLTVGQWHQVKEEGQLRTWLNPSRDFMQQRLGLSAPNDLTPNYPNMASLRAHFDSMGRQEKFVVVGLEFLNIQGVEGFSTIFKYKNPKNPMGHLFLSMIMLVSDRFFCGFHFRAEEQGTTGEREAAVYMILKAQDKLPPEFVQTDKQPPKAFSSMDEYFDMVKSRPAMPHFSDEAQYDMAFPDHPLSRVRRYMKQVAETIAFDDEVKRAKPFRGPAWKPAR